MTRCLDRYGLAQAWAYLATPASTAPMFTCAQCAAILLIDYNCFHYSIQSTPRDEEEAAMRSTPGVVFQGHQRPSTVTGQVADKKEVMSFLPGRRHLIMSAILGFKTCNYVLLCLEFYFQNCLKFLIFSMTLLEQNSQVRGISLQCWHQVFQLGEKVVKTLCCCFL